MRILYVHYKDPAHRPSGMEVHIGSSAAAIRTLGHDIRILPMLGDPPPMDESRRKRERSDFRKQVARFVYAPRCVCLYLVHWIKLWRAIQAYRPDVLLVRYAVLEWSDLILAKLLRLPIVFEVNSTSFEIRHWKSSEVFLYPFTSALERAVFKAADGLLVISDDLKRALVASGIPERSITTNPNGADPERFYPTPPDNESRRRLGLENLIVVGFLGSFARWHDLATLFEITPNILQRNRHVRFIFAGGDFRQVPPQSRPALELLKDRVIFAPSFPVSEAPEFLATMDIVLTLYARLEPFYFSPVKLFEYMAAGKAIVATAIGQQAQVIKDGINGLLVEPGDALGVQTKVQMLIDDPSLRQMLGAEARKCLVANYTWEHNAKRIIQLCESAVDKRGQRQPS